MITKAVAIAFASLNSIQFVFALTKPFKQVIYNTKNSHNFSVREW